MVWEKRSRTPTRYFTKSKRKNGKVKREYIGSLNDPLVEILAREERLLKATKDAVKDTQVLEEQIYISADAAISCHQQQLTQVLDYWLRTRRYRRDRHVWSKAMRIHKPSELKSRNVVPLTKEEFDALLKRVELGNSEALAELRDLFHGDRKTWSPFGDLTEHVKQLFLRLMAPNTPVVSESLKIRLEELASDMGREDSSPMKQMIIDSVLLSWLDYHYALTLSTESSESKGQTEKLDRRLARSQKRYYSALEFLGRMDKLNQESAAS